MFTNFACFRPKFGISVLEPDAGDRSGLPLQPEQGRVSPALAPAVRIRSAFIELIRRFIAAAVTRIKVPGSTFFQPLPVERTASNSQERPALRIQNWWQMCSSAPKEVASRISADNDRQTTCRVCERGRHINVVIHIYPSREYAG
jgi:hypothetical protein